MAGRVENLRPFKPGEKRTRDAAAKGGRAAKAANLEKKTLREWCESLMHAKAPGKVPMTNGQKMVLAQMRAAQKGNAKAFVAVAEVLGERKGVVNITAQLPTLIDDVPYMPDPVRPDAAPANGGGE